MCCVFGCLSMWPFVMCSRTVRRYRKAQRRDAIRRWLYQARIVPKSMISMDISAVPPVDARDTKRKSRQAHPGNSVGAAATDHFEMSDMLPMAAASHQQGNEVDRLGDDLDDIGMYSTDLDELGLSDRDYGEAIRNHIDAFVAPDDLEEDSEDDESGAGAGAEKHGSFTPFTPKHGSADLIGHGAS